MFLMICIYIEPFSTNITMIAVLSCVELHVSLHVAMCRVELHVSLHVAMCRVLFTTSGACELFWIGLGFVPLVSNIHESILSLLCKSD